MPSDMYSVKCSTRTRFFLSGGSARAGGRADGGGRAERGALPPQRHRRRSRSQGQTFEDTGHPKPENRIAISWTPPHLTAYMHEKVLEFQSSSSTPPPSISFLRCMPRPIDLVLNTLNYLPETYNQPATYHPSPQTQPPKSYAPNLGPSTQPSPLQPSLFIRKSNPETRNPKPDTRNPKPKTLNPISESQKPKTPNPEPQT